MTHEPYVPLVDAVRQAGVSYHSVYSAVQSGRIPAKEHKVGTVRKYEVRLSDLHLWRESRNPQRVGIGGKPKPTITVTSPQPMTITAPTPETKEEPAVALPQPALPTDLDTPVLRAVAPHTTASASMVAAITDKARFDLEDIELKIMELEDRRNELRSVVDAAERLSRYLEQGA